MELSDFLLARIAEEASYAEHAKWAMQGEWFATADDKVDEFVRHMSPSRVLAECEAKRAVLGTRQSFIAAAKAAGTLQTRLTAAGAVAALDALLPFLSLPYADHPDYDPVWRP